MRKLKYITAVNRSAIVSLVILSNAICFATAMVNYLLDVLQNLTLHEWHDAVTEQGTSDTAYVILANTEACFEYEKSLDYWMQFPRWVFCLVGLIGNVLEILVFRSKVFGGHRKLLIFMAVVDLLSLTFRMASHVMSLVMTDELGLNTSTCVKITFYALTFMMRNVAMLLLAGTSFARYRSLASPFRRKKSQYFLIFLASLASSVPCMVIATYMIENLISSDHIRIYFLTRLNLLYVVHFSSNVVICTMTGTLLVIFNVLAVLNVRNRPTKNPSTRVCVKIIALSSAVFICLCALPKAIMSILSLTHILNFRNFDCSVVTASMVIKVLAILDVLHSSCLDNLIYLIFSKTYRSKAGIVLKQMFCLEGRRQTRAPKAASGLIETWV